LKPWVKVVFATYIAVTIPVLTFLFALMVKNLPKLVVTTWDALLHQRVEFSIARANGDVLTMFAVAVQVLFLLIQFFGVGLILYSVLRVPIGIVRVLIRSRRRPAAAAALGVTATALLLVGLTWGVRTGSTRSAAPAGVQSFAVTDRTHVDGPVDYPQVPPVAGDHAPIWQNCGFYDQPVVEENAVHSLEHGAVWITYRPDLTETQIGTLYALAQRDPYVLVSPYPDLPAPVVASAWNHQLRLDTAADPRLAQFVSAFRLGPQAPEPGGACTGGTGVPK